MANLNNLIFPAGPKPIDPIPAVARGIFSFIGEDPSREGLERTPERYAKAMLELTRGYKMTDLDAVGSGVFASESNGPICVQGVEFFSLCEHHLLPFWGSASVAYLPGNKILGLSKVARIVDMYARRLQVQERLTSEVVECIKRAVNPRAVVVAVEAQHMCMMMRGVNKVGSSTKTQVVWHADDVSSQELDRLIAQLTRG